MLDFNTFGSGVPNFPAITGVEYLDVATRILYIQKQIPFGTAWIKKDSPIFPHDGIQSVTGLNTDNTDPYNPVVKISIGSGLSGQGTPGSPLIASGAEGSSISVPVLANVDISKYDVVTSDGYIASTSLPGKRNRTLGFAKVNILSTFMGDVVVEGELTNVAWAWTVGLPIFLNGTSPSQTCPSTGFTQILGTAIRVDTIEVNIHQSILI